MNVSIGILYGIIAMVCYGVANSIAKIPIKTLGSTKTIYLREFLLLGFLILSFPFISTLGTGTLSWQYALIALLIGILGYLPLFTFYKALNVGKVGVIAPIANSSVIFTVLFSLIFFKESISLLQSGAVFLIIVGILLISLNFKDIKNSQLFNWQSGVPYALVSCFLWGIVYFLLKIPATTLGPFLSAFFIELGVFSGSIAHLLKIKKSFSFPKKHTLFFISILSLCGALGMVAFNAGIQVSQVSIVAPLMFANPIVAALISALFFKEKLATQQYVSIALIIIGILLLFI